MYMLYIVVCCVSGVSHIQFCSRGHVSSMSVAWLSLALGRAHGVFFPDVFFAIPCCNKGDLAGGVNPSRMRI